ncbi:uncharacterized protein SETTUDRAFT_105082 [Exserohilum turcica Et28A]|uniref:Heterokaryon incompatibility domain-containing protein n=1 Tax=Exserohilum turcicum (strain 28A) TaxID=671987 RepID=R0KJB7_EXST2|nr:uncharacterized protein SETTUDRAFT_105082 [Exserohilum turcica Et28A]EOA89264.1 hypothetical protein SETTUDRAFT_105082 [Exserohilum turcica Et28A]
MQDIDQISSQVSSILETPYQYNKLPRDDSFRYLILQPGVGNEQLDCSLCTAPLPQIEFEAISYVWGKDIKNKRIICNGRSIKVTANLYNVLQRVRLPNEPRKLWADGICINQEDSDEKGHQVAIMGQLYRSAKRVLIYVGPDKGSHGPQLCSLLDEVDQMIKETCQNIDMSYGSFPFPDENSTLLSNVRWASMYHLLCEEWFERGWVVREAAFAQVGQVIWGSSSFDWGNLMRAYCWSTMRATQTLSDAGVFSRDIVSHVFAYARRNRSFSGSLSIQAPSKDRALLEDLENAAPLHVSDPRDRIYAFMELSRDNEHAFTMTPDYTSPYLDVYRQFVVEHTKFTRTPCILDYVFHPISALNLSAASWIPRWDLRGSSVIISTRKKTVLTSRNSFIYEPGCKGKTTFACRGVVLDSVRFVSHILTDKSTTLQTLSEVWKNVNLHTQNCPYRPADLLDAFLDTLCLGRYDDNNRSWNVSRTAFATDVILEAESSPPGILRRKEPENGTYYNVDGFLESVLNWANEGRFVITERGYMGIAPAVTQVGDLCAIIFGCSMPCMLRPTGPERYYNFVGASFVTGKEKYRGEDGQLRFGTLLGSEGSKDWVGWDVEEQDIHLV